ncbi:MFS transporter [Idiomarina sp. M1R2S28]|uniref:MFS transporter n=1 Tax=Idiomarina rhizosphaerae TaxID=2961572 RepID=A0A9X2JUE2_9GAMM|nr:MFS transporter [Idiomarina rhizosphaerae]MCP1338896.1 MFS transporter [Idiomarina rhizosphaerae]
MLSNTKLHQQLALPLIILSQLLGTSLWFSINGVWLPLSAEHHLNEADLGAYTLAVQLGFIIGTLTLALTGLADRYRASQIFLLSSIAGALVNALFIVAIDHSTLGWLLRFLTGLCLAGIYPMGMKLVISWVPRYAGSALSWLLAMLTLGTALPHLMRGITLDFSWEIPLLTSSILALLGGLLVGWLGSGPHLPSVATSNTLRSGLRALTQPKFRAIAIGYFGHAWELYAFWMLTPLLVLHPLATLNLPLAAVPWLAFSIIAIGSLGCIGGGIMSKKIGGLRVARLALFSSGAICLLYPLMTGLPAGLIFGLLLLWGLTVIADSPQFSALAAQFAPKENIGSALAIMNAIGFSLTLPAIWLTSNLWSIHNEWVTWLLLPGPVIGLWAMRKLSA